MKINSEISEYDVKNLDEIYAAVETIHKQCQMLSESADIMDHNVSVAEKDFTSQNMERAREVIQKYQSRLLDAQTEFKELLDSVEEFADKLRNAWRAW